jgi:hypothetical protein
LIPSTGWFEALNTGTLVDAGSGNITITPTGEPGYAATVARTDLENTPVICTDPYSSTSATITCPIPLNYPKGSASYQLTVTYPSSQFILYGDGVATQVTDSTGTPLAALPTLNTTPFCNPSFSYVFNPKGSGVYDIIPTPSCTTGEISLAITSGTPTGTVVIEDQPTGNAVVTHVLHIASATGNSSVTTLVDMTFGERAGAVWYGWMGVAKTYLMEPVKNKTATSMELIANGMIGIP